MVVVIVLTAVSWVKRCCRTLYASSAARLTSEVLLRVCLRFGHSGILDSVIAGSGCGGVSTGCGGSSVTSAGVGGIVSSSLLLNILLSKVAAVISDVSLASHCVITGVADCGDGVFGVVCAVSCTAHAPKLVSGVVGDGGGVEAKLSSLLLLKTAAAASSHVGIGGIFFVLF